MELRDIYLKNGTLFAKGFERVVHGGRGDYVEFTRDQIVPQLLYKMSLSVFDEQKANKEPKFYYYWLIPSTDEMVKVYYQLAEVNYADYKVGYYYVAPAYFNNFHENRPLF